MLSQIKTVPCWWLYLVLGQLSIAVAADEDIADLASQVTIHRDEWGVPHVFGDNLQAASLGMGFAQAEDYFWQVEDNCIRAAGRYAEIYGPTKLRSDLLNRMFEITRRSQEDFLQLKPLHRRCIAAFAEGLNF